MVMVFFDTITFISNHQANSTLDMIALKASVDGAWFFLIDYQQPVFIVVLYLETFTLALFYERYLAESPTQLQ